MADPSVRLVVDRKNCFEAEQIRPELILNLGNPVFETMRIEVPGHGDESRRPTTRCCGVRHGVLRGMEPFEAPGGRVRVEGPDGHEALEAKVGQGGDIAHHTIGNGNTLRRRFIIGRPPLTGFGNGGVSDNNDAVEVDRVARQLVSEECRDDRRHIGIAGGRDDHVVRKRATPAEVLDDRHEVEPKGAARTVIVGGERNPFLGMDLDPGPEVSRVDPRVDDCRPTGVGRVDQAAGERRGVGAEAASDNRDWN